MSMKVWGSAVVAAVVVVSVGGCSASGAGSLDDALAQDEQLTFQVGGTAKSAMITYVTDGLGMSQEASAKVPWKKTVKFTEGTLGVNMNAQNGGASGTITCKITDEGGKVLSENASSGAYAVVSCAV